MTRTYTKCTLTLVSGVNPRLSQLHEISRHKWQDNVSLGYMNIFE